MSDLIVKVLQQPIIWQDPKANLKHFDHQLQHIDHADLVVLPEMFTSGFSMQAAENALEEDEVIAWLAGHARRLNALVGGSVALKTSQGAVNRFLLVADNQTVFRYDKRHLFRMANEHHHYQAGHQRKIIAWRGWRILPLICYDLRFPVFSRNQGDYDLAIYVASWPQARAAHWNTLLLARAIENQAWVIGCNRIGIDGHGLHYQGDSQIISPQGEIIKQAAPEQAECLEAVLSLHQLQHYRETFPAWRDADPFTLQD